MEYILGESEANLERMEAYRVGLKRSSTNASFMERKDTRKVGTRLVCSMIRTVMHAQRNMYSEVRGIYSNVICFVSLVGPMDASVSLAI